ncbi:MAG: hypothetical protein M1820_001270 [Bogoriella megaspora]|nr:MAG: hypothetical protein M1820_001270 [Bogoriella megaspora]
MRIKQDSPIYICQETAALLETKISDLETLKQKASGSVLVAFKANSPCSHDVEEVGFASLKVDGKNPPQLPPTYHRTVGVFYDETDVTVHAVVTYNSAIMSPGRGSRKYGNTDEVDAKELGDAVHRKLSALGHSNNLILVGWDPRHEFKWISSACPALASLFTACVDLQEIAKNQATYPTEPTLRDTMRGMGFKDFFSTRPSDTVHPHRAANMAVRLLAVATGFSTLESLTIHPSKYGKIKNTIPTDNGPFAAFIRTADGKQLPREINRLESLLKLFEKYDPKTVAMDVKEIDQRGGVDKWWINFATLELVEAFIGAVHGSRMGEDTLMVEGTGWGNIPKSHSPRVKLQEKTYFLPEDFSSAISGLEIA